jgi:hypothetical protein
MTIIRAGRTNSTSLSIEADNSDEILFKSVEANVMLINNDGVTLLSDLVIPSGNTLQRPANPITGEIRFNTSINAVEGYNGNDWITVRQV